MFAFALWDEAEQRAVLRPRSLRHQAVLLHRASTASLYFASEVKALLPFLPTRSRPTSTAFKDYLDVPVLPRRQDAVQGRPGAAARPHCWSRRRGQVRRPRATGRSTTTSTSTTPRSTSRSELRELLDDSVDMHLRSGRARRRLPQRRPRLEHRRRARHARARAELRGVHRQVRRSARATTRARYARAVAERRGFALHEIDITADDFVENIRQVIYHLDYPVAGPGSFPQYMVSQLAAQHAQGRARRTGRRRDLRRLRALPDRLLRAVHQGGDRRHDAQRQLRRHLRVDHSEPRRRCASYKPLLQEFWRDGLFDDARPALLPPDQPRADAGRRDPLGGARRLRRRSRRSGPSSGPTTSARNRTSTA